MIPASALQRLPNAGVAGDSGPRPRRRGRVVARLAGVVLLALRGAQRADAQIHVNPTGVDVNGQGATTVFLTFGPLIDYAPAESFWCGEVVDATPDIGRRCNATTLFGALPARLDQARLHGTGFTDIMSIPPSVTRRAWQAAAAGAVAPFFYVRRFVSTRGAPDQYVAVTCRLTGGGARVPLSLTNVNVAFAVETPVLQVPAGQSPPPLRAKIAYTGTGRLVGRWEIVRPGEELPEAHDLLTEATLPLEERGTQKRYSEIQRFNVFLAPGGSFTLPGPDASRLPVNVEGMYLLLLRIEASNDKEGDSNLSTVGGTGVVHSGAVAGFPMPALRYVVGTGGSEQSPVRVDESLRLLLPADNAVLSGDRLAAFSWVEDPRAALYRLEIETAAGDAVLSAFAERGRPWYSPPPWLAQRVTEAGLRWRVVALDAGGGVLGRSAWRRLAPTSAPGG